MNRAWPVCVCVTVALLLSLRAGAQVQTLVLEGGTSIDGKGGNPINDAVVVIEGSRIKAVGVRGTVSYPEDARLEGNPLADIAATKNVRMVVGEWVAPASGGG